MLADEQTVFCDGCGAEIGWVPVIVKHHRYCCSDCAEDRTCTCGMQAEWEDERRDKEVAGMEA